MARNNTGLAKDDCDVNMIWQYGKK